jgi:hypothetical protein
MQTGIGRAQMGSIETQNERGPKCLGGAGGSGRIFGEYGSIFGECGMGGRRRGDSIPCVFDPRSA